MRSWHKVCHLVLHHNQQIHLKKALKATVLCLAFDSVAKNIQVVLAVRILRIKCFGGKFFVCQGFFPILREFRFCNSNHPAMDNIYFPLCIVPTKLWKNLHPAGCWVSLWFIKGLCYHWLSWLVGLFSFNAYDFLFQFSDNKYDEHQDFILSTMSQQSWSKRKHQFEHDYAITGWVLSFLPGIQEDVVKDKMATQEWWQRGLSPNSMYHQKQILKHLKCLWKLFLISFEGIWPHPEYNWTLWMLFWQVLNTNTSKLGIHLSSSLLDALHLCPWFVACQVTSKRLGFGSSKGSRSDVKQLKDG